MSINGTVSLPISELDNLRNTISNLESQVIEKDKLARDIEDRSKQVRLTISAREPYINTESFIRTEMNKARMDLNRPSYGFNRYLASDEEDKVYNNVYKELLSRPFEQICSSREYLVKTDYINFQEVEGDLQLKAQERVQDRIVLLENRTNELIEEVSTDRIKHNKTVSEIYDKHREEITAIKSLKDEEILTLKNKVKELMDEEQELTTQALIADLKRQLEIERSKPWYKRLF